MNTDNHTAPVPAAPKSALRRAGRILLPLLVVVIGVGTAMTLVKTAPRPKKVHQERKAPRVTVEALERKSTRPLIEAMGTVRPAEELALRPRVAGRVLGYASELVPGGKLAKDTVALTIDPADYELALRQAETNLAEAEANLAIEEGRQVVAQRELELLGEELTESERALTLRAPQRATATAQVHRAAAVRDQAQLNLERTKVTVPFDAVVRERAVGQGAEVSSATTLATLVGTDTFWIELLVPTDSLAWIELPGPGHRGAAARIHDDAAWGADVFRTGHVFRLESDVDSAGRMARLLVAVEDPLSLRRENAELPPLLNGSYVRVELEGCEAKEVFVIERAHLRTGDELWILDENEQLDRRVVTPLFRGRDTVLVAEGLRTGERLVTSGIAAPVHGMTLDASSQPGTKKGRKPSQGERSAAEGASR